MVTTTTTPTPPSAAPNLESLTYIDISTLSQSELHSLSLCSTSAFHHQPDDLVVPRINRSVFNESAGTRRQTFSRRLHPHRRPPLPSDSSAAAENKSIVNYLKQLLNQTNNLTNSNDLIVNNDTNPEAIVVDDSIKKKRKRERKPEEKVELKNLNQNGVVVDFGELANADEFYSEELRRRTESLGTEEEGLGFLRGLDGQWCSRRKKRKFVDASEFGDKFPVGWKLLLGLRRPKGHVSVYCRRYISPSGEQFVSCKEAASYLQHYVGDRADHPMDQTSGSIQQVYEVTSGTHAGLVDKDNAMQLDIIDNSALPGSSISDANGKELSLLGIENLAEVQIRNIFDCSKCKMTFEKKDEYLRHLLSVHQNTTRRYRLCASVGNGVIIKDGTYECQFCHKAFQERQSYIGHVGVHVRNHVRNSVESPAQVSAQKSTESLSMSKMDALIEIAQNSALENPNNEPTEKRSSGSSPDKLNMQETSAAGSDHEPSLGCHLSETGYCMADAAPGMDLKPCDSEHTTTNEDVVNISGISSIGTNVNVVCSSTSDHHKLDKVEKHGSSELEVICGINHVNSNEIVSETRKQIEENTLPTGVIDSSMPPVQSLHCFPSFNAISDEGENGISSADQKFDNISGFEELKLDEIEPLRFSFVNGQQTVSLPEVSMELANDVGMGEGFNSPTRFEPETIVLNFGGRHQLTSVCVWCRNEFNHEAINFDIQSDSIGFMCPTCKAKISGHLDSGLSMNSHQF